MLAGLSLAGMGLLFVGLVGVSYDYGNSSGYRSRAAFSANAGTWRNVTIATASSAYANDGFSGSFMGDYAGNAWAGKTFHMSWTDTRTGAGQDFTGGVSF